MNNKTIQSKIEKYEALIQFWTVYAKHEAATVEINRKVWDMVEDYEQKLWNLKRFGQETEPADLQDETGVRVGYVLDNGETVYFAGVERNV